MTRANGDSGAGARLFWLRFRTSVPPWSHILTTRGSISRKGWGLMVRIMAYSKFVWNRKSQLSAMSNCQGTWKREPQLEKVWGRCSPSWSPATPPALVQCAPLARREVCCLQGWSALTAWFGTWQAGELAPEYRVSGTEVLLLYTPRGKYTWWLDRQVLHTFTSSNLPGMSASKSNEDDSRGTWLRWQSDTCSTVCPTSLEERTWGCFRECSTFSIESRHPSKKIRHTPGSVFDRWFRTLGFPSYSNKNCEYMIKANIIRTCSVLRLIGMERRYEHDKETIFLHNACMLVLPLIWKKTNL